MYNINMLAFYKKYTGYFVIFGGFLVQLSFGIFFSFGYIRKDIIIAMNESSMSPFNVKSSNTIWIYGLMLFGLGTAVSAGGFLERRIGPQLTVLIGGWWMSLNVFITFWTIKTYIAIVIVSYGLFVGIGIGLAYGSTFFTASKWFPNRKGLVIGIILSGVGLSTSIVDFITANINFYLFLILGIACALVQLVGAILLKQKPIETTVEGQFQSYSDIYNPYYCDSIFKSKPLEMEPHQILLEFDFWILWLIFCLNSISNFIITAFYYEYGKHLKIEKSPMLYISITVGIFNFFGRIFWGYWIDKKPFKMIMMIITIFTSVFTGTLNVMPYLSISTIKYIYGLWLCIISLFTNGNISIFPTVCVSLFGWKNFIINYGMIFTASTFSGTIVSVASAFHDDSHEVYSIAFYTACASSLAAAGLTILFRGRSLMTYKI